MIPTDTDAQMAQRNKNYGASVSTELWVAKHKEHVKKIFYANALCHCWVKSDNLSRDSICFLQLPTPSWNIEFELRRAKGNQQRQTSFESYRTTPTAIGQKDALLKAVNIHSSSYSTSGLTTKIITNQSMLHHQSLTVGSTSQDQETNCFRFPEK